ncbi:MAG: MotA/TolQ/ExbB proton channel family protein [Chitinophagales bacterium]
MKKGQIIFALALTVAFAVMPESSFAQEAASWDKVLLNKFIEGGAGFMSLVLIALILGLAFCIERIIALSLASTNTKKLLDNVGDNLANGNVDGAKEVCKANRSPIASIMHQGLERVDDGVDAVEKAVVAYGSVEMGNLEKGLTWISLFIALAPMLGFMGTVIGMIEAFDAIQAQGDISPTVVAGGIKVALLTTVFGLVAAIILQIFYNFIVTRIDSIVNDMEGSSITFVDMLIHHNIVKK